MRLSVQRVVRDCGALVCAASLVTATVHAAPRPGQGAQSRAAAAPRRSAEAFDAFPMAFEPNVGQTDARVKFLARGPGYTLFLAEGEAVLSLSSKRSPAEEETGRDSAAKRPGDAVASDSNRDVLRVRLEGARAGARIDGERELPGTSHYLTGSDPSRWRRGVPTFAAVRYEGVYDGIDAVFYGRSRHLEYDFVVRPGADPSQARVRFEGQERVEVTEEGDLVLRMPGGEVRQQRAVAFQETGSGLRQVGARYAVGPAGDVTFALGAYDATRPLVIDPVLSFSEFLVGGNVRDQVEDIAIDDAGAVYAAGFTESTVFPTTPGAADATAEGEEAFVTKLSPDGSTLLYSTYLGGDFTDRARSIAVDGSGAAYVAGSTQSLDFPTTPGAFDTTHSPEGSPYSEVFVTKLSPDGASLVYSTFLGGDRGEIGGFLALHPSGAVSVSGVTGSTDFPTTPGAYDRVLGDGMFESADAFVARLNPTGTALEYSTFLGGALHDEPTALAVDELGNAFVVGSTSGDFPTTPGALDTDGGLGFAAKVAADGSSLVYSTYLGGSGGERPEAVFVRDGFAYVTGQTESTDFPTTPGAFDTAYNSTSNHGDAYVAKLSVDGASLVYSTYLGGQDHDRGYGVTVDATGAAYVTGGAESTDFPTTPGAYCQEYSGGVTDVFVTKLNPAGSALLYSTFVGGFYFDTGRAVEVDAAGAAYVGGYTGSGNYPSTAGAFDERFNGDVDAIVTKLSPDGASLVYSTYLDGRAEDSANAIHVTPGAGAVVTGSTPAPDFPDLGALGVPYDATHNGGDDAFVLRIGPSTQNGEAFVYYMTFLGGAGDDVGHAITTDSGGIVYVAGVTASVDFPATPGARDVGYGGAGDAFVASVSADGAELRFATLLGGAAADEARGIAVGADATIYVAGRTDSAGFPTTPGALDRDFGGESDGFVARLSADASALLYSTFLGGALGGDAATSVAVDPAGAAFVAGRTAATDFPTTSGAFDTSHGGAGANDAFVARVSPSGGALVYSTFLGGSGDDEARAVRIDVAGSAYVVGRTASSGFPTTPGAHDTSYGGGGDAFVAKLAASGSSLVYSIFYGGSGDDAAYGLAVDGDGNAYVAGTTTSADLTTAGTPIDTTFNGGVDGFVTILRPDGSGLEHSTYMGGHATDLVNGIGVDARRRIYIVGQSDSFQLPHQFFDGHAGTDAFYGIILTPGVLPASGDSAGIYSSATGAWFLRYANVAGNADAVFHFGPGGGLVPLSGDWDGDGDDTPGLYDPGSGAFFLKNSLGYGPADLTFFYGTGGAGAVPLVGDWNNDGADTVGIYITANGAFFLKNENSGGAADYVFFFGVGGAGVVPIVGDWDGNGWDTIGLHAAATGAFFLRNQLDGGAADLVFFYGGGGSTAVIGDWDGDGTDTVGIYAPASGAWFLKNENAGGAADLTFFYGGPNAAPLSGNWDAL